MDNTNQSSSYNFFLSRPFSLIIKSKEFSNENNLIFKSIKFFSNKNKQIFSFLHNKAIENDIVLRIEEENNQGSFFKKFRWIIKNILTEMKLYYLIKYFYLKLFKSNYFYKRIVVFDKRLTKIVKKNINSFVKIIEFNKNYKL